MEYAETAAIVDFLLWQAKERPVCLRYPPMKVFLLRRGVVIIDSNYKCPDTLRTSVLWTKQRRLCIRYLCEGVRDLIGGVWRTLHMPLPNRVSF